jgi:hypothetical protein
MAGRDERGRKVQLERVTHRKVVYLTNRNGKPVGIFCGDETQ